MLKNLRVGLKNIKYWWPVVYKDRQWDEEYLYKIINHKLSSMEVFFDSDESFALRGNKKAAKIREVKKALSRLIRDEYISNMSMAEANQKREQDNVFVFDNIRDHAKEWWV